MKNIKIVNVLSGEQQVAAVDESLGHFWRVSDLKKDGQPDKRNRPGLLGIRNNFPDRPPKSWHYAAKWNVLPPDDSQGEELRRQLREAEEALERAQVAIFRHYAGEAPLPKGYLPSRHPARNPEVNNA